MPAGVRTRVGGFVAGGVVVSAYRYALRHSWLTWGATREETTMALPGDELLEAADVVTTRAVTITTPPAAVWPWLVQMGPGRGGAYTYDWIENLFGLGMHSANEILPQFQDLAVGDTIRLGANGPTMRIEILTADRVMTSRSDDGSWAWILALLPTPGGTRLVSRNRIRTPSVTSRLAMILMVPASLIMERKMLVGIKRRAERHHARDRQ
jgi:hypothetical protein